MSAVRSRQHPPNSLFNFVVLISHSGRSKHRLGVVVQLVRIPACHAGGRGFEPRPLRQHKKMPVSFWKRAFFYLLFLLRGLLYGTPFTGAGFFCRACVTCRVRSHPEPALVICITVWLVRPPCCPRDSAGNWFSSPSACPWTCGPALLAEYSQRVCSACLRSVCHP